MSMPTFLFSPAGHYENDPPDLLFLKIPCLISSIVQVKPPITYEKSASKSETPVNI